MQTRNASLRVSRWLGSKGMTRLTRSTVAVTGALVLAGLALAATSIPAMVA